MLEFAVQQDHPVALRYPKTAGLELPNHHSTPIRLGRSEEIRSGQDGAIIAYGPMLQQALEAAELLAADGIETAVINARFCKPMDLDLLQRIWEPSRFIVTLEEAALQTGFGSAVLEAANELGLDTRKLKRLGIPDQFIEHGERGELLKSLHLDGPGIAATCRQRLEQWQPSSF